MRRLEVRALAAVVLAGSLVMQLEGAVLADISYRFDAVIGERCVFGHGPLGDQFTVTLRANGGALRSQVVTATDFQLRFSACFDKRVRSGDRITADNGEGASRTVIVPILTTTTNRVFDTVSGVADAGATLHIKLMSCVFAACPHQTTIDTVTHADGSYSVDFTSRRPARGGDIAEVVEDAGYDTFSRMTPFPFMTAWIGDQVVTGGLATGRTATIRLLSRAGTQRGVAHAKGDADQRFSAELRSGGSPVNVARTNVLKGSFATDASLTVAAVRVVGSEATDSITGRCLPNGRYLLQWGEGPDQGSAPGIANATGAFNVDLSTTVYTLAGGDVLELLCLSPRGDRIGVRSIVP